MTQPTLSVSIVLYDTEPNTLAACLNALKESATLAQTQKLLSHLTIYIVDNNPSESAYQKTPSNCDLSFDGSYTYLPQSTNLGYGAGNNIAIRLTEADFHLILNPDVFCEQNTLSAALTYMAEHPEIGLLSPAVFGVDGQQHYLCRQHPTLFDQFLRGGLPKTLRRLFRRRIHRFEMRERDYQQVMIDVPSLSGCFMLFRTPVLKKIDGFDERYFLYLEDADLSRRCLEISDTAYVPSVKVTHVWQQGSHHQWQLKKHHIRSSLKYFLRWGGWF